MLISSSDLIHRQSNNDQSSCFWIYLLGKTLYNRERWGESDERIPIIQITLVRSLVSPCAWFFQRSIISVLSECKQQFSCNLKKRKKKKKKNDTHKLDNLEWYYAWSDHEIDRSRVYLNLSCILCLIIRQHLMKPSIYVLMEDSFDTR